MSNVWPTDRLGNLLTVLTDYHANGSYKKLKENVTLLTEPDYALMIRTTNFERGDFSDELRFIDEQAYNFLHKSKVLPDDILMNKIANPGSVYRMPDLQRPVSLAMNLFLIRTNSKKLDQIFAYYFLKANEAYIKSFTAGAATATITKKAVKDLEIATPDLNMQRKIVGILSAYDDLIENNRRRIQLLEQAARLLYKEWFVHLRFPGHEHVKIKDGVPDGWEKKMLFDIASLTYGFAFKSKLFNTDGEGLPVARIRNIPSGESQTYTTEEAPEEKLLENGDFVIGMDGDFHMNFWTGGKTWINQRVVRINGAGDVSGAFLRYACEKHIQDFNATIVGTTVAHLGAKHLKIIEILIPPKSILYDAQDFFDSIQSQIVALSNQIRLATKARDLLLPRLMNREVAV